jgi:hypothetical protein
MVRGCRPHAQPPSWRTTPCRLSATAYSIYSQLPSISGGLPSIRNLRTRHAVVTRNPPNMVRPSYIYIYIYILISYTPRSRYPRYQLGRSLGWPQRWSGHSGGEEKSSHHLKISVVAREGKLEAVEIHLWSPLITFENMIMWLLAPYSVWHKSCFFSIWIAFYHQWLNLSVSTFSDE